MLSSLKLFTRTAAWDESLKRIVSSTFWLTSERIYRLLVGVGITVWLARYLQPEGFGQLNYAVSFIALFAPVAGMGLDGLIVRGVLSKSNSKHEILGTAFVIRVVAGFAAIFIALAVSLFMHPLGSPVNGLVFILAATLLFQAAAPIDYWYQSHLRAVPPTLGRNIAFTAATSARAVFILAGLPVMAFAWIITGEALALAVALFVAYGMSGERVRLWTYSSSCARKMLKDSWPILLSAVAVVIYMKIDQIMLGQMLGARAVGIYSAATRISELWYFVPMAIVTSASPIIMANWEQDRDAYVRKMIMLFRVMIGLSILVALPVTFFGNDVIRILYGEHYKDAGVILAIHIWAGLFVALNVSQWPAVFSEGLMIATLIRTSLGAITNVLLNLALIPTYGMVGAAVATILSYGVAAVLANVMFSGGRRILAMQYRALMIWRPI